MRTLAFAAATISSLCLCNFSYGLLALQNGKTSIKPTSTDPARYQAQLSTDPIGIVDFQITQKFDPTRVLPVTFSNVVPVNGYVLGVRGNPNATGIAIDNVLGLVSVRGYWPSTVVPVPGDEIDVFVVNYEFRREFPIDLPVSFSTLGLTARESLFGPDSPDFLIAGIVRPDGTVATETRYVNDGSPNRQIDRSDTPPGFSLASPYLSVLGQSGASEPLNEFTVPSIGGAYQLTVYDNVDAGSDRVEFAYDPGNPDYVTIAFDFLGSPTDIANAIAALNLNPNVDPGFGGGYDAQIKVPGGNSVNYVLDYRLTGLNVSMSRIAALPEPASLAVFGALLPLVSRRRR